MVKDCCVGEIVQPEGAANRRVQVTFGRLGMTSMAMECFDPGAKRATSEGNFRETGGMTSMVRGRLAGPFAAMGSSGTTRVWPSSQRYIRPEKPGDSGVGRLGRHHRRGTCRECPARGASRAG